MYLLRRWRVKWLDEQEITLLSDGFSLLIKTLSPQTDNNEAYIQRDIKTVLLLSVLSCQQTQQVNNAQVHWYLPYVAALVTGRVVLSDISRSVVCCVLGSRPLCTHLCLESKRFASPVCLMSVRAAQTSNVLRGAEGPRRRTLVLYEAVKAEGGVEGVKLSGSGWAVCLLCHSAGEVDA